MSRIMSNFAVIDKSWIHVDNSFCYIILPKIFSFFKNSAKLYVQFATEIALHNISVEKICQIFAGK